MGDELDTTPLWKKTALELKEKRERAKESSRKGGFIIAGKYGKYHFSKIGQMTRNKGGHKFTPEEARAAALKGCEKRKAKKEAQRKEVE